MQNSCFIVVTAWLALMMVTYTLAEPWDHHATKITEYVLRIGYFCIFVVVWRGLLPRFIASTLNMLAIKPFLELDTHHTCDILITNRL